MNKNYQITYEGDTATFTFRVDEIENQIVACVMLEDDTFCCEENISIMVEKVECIVGLTLFSNESVQGVMVEEPGSMELRYYMVGTDINKFIALTLQVFDIFEDLDIESIGTI